MKKFFIIIVVISLLISTVAAADTTVLYCTGNSVNERTAPNTDAKVVRQHDAGERIEVIQKKHGWYQLVNGNWMSAKYLSEKSKAKETYSYLYIKGDSVNEREKPSTRSNVLKVHYLGRCVKIVGTEGSWSKTSNGSYIRTDLLCSLTDLISTYKKKYTDIIIICINSQEATYYKKGESIASSSIVTGSNKTPTPTGLYTVFDKDTNTYLMEDSYVNYFVEFNQGVGIHDASWRKYFGGRIYKESGSHGCVNTPLEFAKTVYNNCTVGSTKVLVIE